MQLTQLNAKQIGHYINKIPLFIKNKLLSKVKSFDYKTSDLTIRFDYLGAGGQGVVYRVGNYAVKFYKSQINDKTTKEIKLIKLSNELIDKNISIHYLRLLEYNIVHNSYVMILDLVNGSLEDWIRIHHTEQEWYQMIFQIIYSVFCLQQCLYTYHSDLKPKNILYKTIDKPICLDYVIKNEEKNNEIIHKKKFITNTIFLISDFGHAQSLLFESNDIPKSSISLFIKNNSDLEHLASFHKRLLVNIILNYYSLEQLINLAKHDEHFKVYYDDQKNIINKEMHTYPDNIRKKMLTRNIAYYLLEKKYIKLDDIISKEQKKYLPTDDVINILEQLDTSTNIIELLKLVSTKIIYKANNDINDTNIIKMCINIK